MGDSTTHPILSMLLTHTASGPPWNRAARILTFSNYEVRSSVLLDKLGWERLEYVRLEQLVVTMYKIHNDLPPRILGGSLPTPQMYTHTILEILS